jgi:hypothetical protein
MIVCIHDTTVEGQRCFYRLPSCNTGEEITLHMLNFVVAFEQPRL